MLLVFTGNIRTILFSALRKWSISSKSYLNNCFKTQISQTGSSMTVWSYGLTSCWALTIIMYICSVRGCGDAHFTNRHTEAVKKATAHLDVIIFSILYSIGVQLRVQVTSLFPPPLSDSGEASRVHAGSVLCHNGVFSILWLKLFEPFLTFHVSLRSQSSVQLVKLNKMFKVPESFNCDLSNVFFFWNLYFKKNSALKQWSRG